MSNSQRPQTHVKQALLSAIVLVSMNVIATAQTTPNTRDQHKQAPQQHGTMQHQQDTHQGWQWFDDNAGRDMNISADRMLELRQMDDRYRKDYDAMGSTPWTHSDYQALTDRRNAEVRGLITSDQYQQWSRSGTKGDMPTQNQNPSTPAPKR